MRSWFLAFLALFAVAGVAQGETCTATATSFRWTAVGTTVPASQWSGCTPTNDDAFVISSSSSDVVVDGTVTVTTGSVTVSGGRLRVSAGITLSPGTALNVSGGTLNLEGTVLWEGRLSSISWGNFAAGATVTLPQDISGFATTADFIVYGDDDPINGTISDPIQTDFAKRPEPGKFRPSYEKWKWYPISAVSGSTATYAYDTWSASGGSGTVYGGTRGPCAESALTATGVAREGLGWTTKISVATATIPDGLVANMTGNCGAQYVEFVTPTAVAGKMAKVLYTEDGGAGSDLIFIAGDALAAGSGTVPTFKIHYGARAGDRVRIVRPAKVSGLVTATNTGVIKWTSGTIKANWFWLDRLGVIDYTAVTPNLGMACQICIYQESASASPASGSYLVNGNISHGEFIGSDTAIFGFSSERGATNVARYAGTMMDFSGITLSKLYIHDQRDRAAEAAGTHGFVIEGVQNLTVNGARIERIADDGIYSANKNFTGSAVGHNSLKRIIEYEMTPGAETSQQGFDITCVGVGSGTTGQLYLQTDGLDIEDAVSIGLNNNTLSYNCLGGNISRFVGGGSNDSDGTPTGGSISIGNIYGETLPDYYAQDHLPNLSDSFFANYGIANIAYRDLIFANVQGTIYFEPPYRSYTSATTNERSLYELKKTAGSVFYWPGTTSGSSSALFAYTSHAEFDVASPSFEDTVFVSPNSKEFCNDFRMGASGTTALTSATLRRAFLAFGAGSTTYGSLYSCLNNNPTYNSTPTIIDGGIFTSTTPGVSGFGGPLTGDGSYMTNVCQATTAQRSTIQACGTSPSSTCLTYSLLGPTAASGGNIAGFAGGKRSDDPCNMGKPTNLGWRQLGVSHAALGDLVLTQLDNFSTWTLGTGDKPKSR